MALKTKSLIAAQEEVLLWSFSREKISQVSRLCSRHRKLDQKAGVPSRPQDGGYLLQVIFSTLAWEAPSGKSLPFCANPGAMSFLHSRVQHELLIPNVFLHLMQHPDAVLVVCFSGCKTYSSRVME